MNALIRLLLPCVLLLTGLAAHGAAPPDGIPNVWLLDGQGRIYGAVNTADGKWSVLAQPQGANHARVTLDDGSVHVLNAQVGGLAPDSVIVNRTPASYPATAAGRPPISILGVGQALSAASSSTTLPLLQVEARVNGLPLANGASTDQTIAFTMQAYPAPDQAGDTTNLQIGWAINGGPTQVHDASEQSARTIYLAANDTYNITVRSRQGTNLSPIQNWALTISGADPLRDTGDGDGIPDVAEAEFGLDPFSSDVNRDADGNGVPDFVDVFCRNYSFTAVPATLDTDHDTASDCEEILRGTNHLDTQAVYPDRPAVVGSLFNPEHLLQGGAYEDLGHNIKFGMSRLRVSTVRGSPVYDSDNLPTDADLGSLAPPILPAEVPGYLRRDLVLPTLTGGDYPAGVRLPADKSLVLYARGDGNPWAARGWISGRAMLDPPLVTQTLLAAGSTWTTGSQWLELFGDYLRDHLVQPVDVPVDPLSGLGLALMDAAVAYYADAGPGALLILGEPNVSPAPNAVDALRLAIAPGFDETDHDAVDPGRSLDQLHQEYLDLMASQALVPEAGLMQIQILNLYWSPTGPGAETTLHAIAAMLQPPPVPGSGCCAQIRYLAALLTRLPLADLLAMPVALLDPLGDYDGEGVPNWREMLHPPPTGSNPLLADTDLDGHSDDYDPCPNSAANTCLNIPYQRMDSDGDGIVDSLDNCMNTPNPDQFDTDLDGFGDACPRHAGIVRPNSNLALFVGDSVYFEGAGQAGAVPPVSYLWDFDGGAANSTALVPGEVPFNTPGEYHVSLTATDANGSTPPDERLIRVMMATPPPSVSLPASVSVEQGATAQILASAAPGHGVIESYTWQFSDGGTGVGNPGSHLFAAAGVYSAMVTVTDSGYRQASASTTVIVGDAVPVAAFSVNRQSGLAPLTVQFTDQSQSWDPIVSWTWDFDDGSAPLAGPNQTHSFTSPGTYMVSLEVEDNDGSVASTTLPIHVLAEPDGDLAPYGAPDGVLDAGDLLVAQRIVLGLIVPSAQDLDHGDVYPPGSPDGVIDLSDLLRLMQMIATAP